MVAIRATIWRKSLKRWRGSKVPNSQANNSELQIELSYTNVEQLKSFSQLLQRDINSILNEALTQYFETMQKKIIEKEREDDISMTNLDYDEFWDGVDIE